MESDSTHETSTARGLSVREKQKVFWSACDCRPIPRSHEYFENLGFRAYQNPSIHIQI
jgi:hypothetical protein